VIVDAAQDNLADAHWPSASNTGASGGVIAV